jgi:hypothetical protein
MDPRIVGLALTFILVTPAQAQKWQLTLTSKGHSMYTDLDGVERVGPHVYRAWSKYVYVERVSVNSDAEALVQKEYDCQQGSRRVLSAVFYDVNGAVTWESKEPGPWTPVTRNKGQRQWSQVCSGVEEGVLFNLISWLKITLRGSTS